MIENDWSSLIKAPRKNIPIDVIVTQTRQVVCFQAPVQNYFTRNCNGTAMKLQWNCNETAIKLQTEKTN